VTKRSHVNGCRGTVRPDGTPALSPTGTTRVWDDGRLKAVVHIDVERAEELVSPAYDDGTPEEVIADRWRRCLPIGTSA